MRSFRIPRLPLLALFAIGCSIPCSGSETVTLVEEKPAFEIAARAGDVPRLFVVGNKGVTLLRGALALSNGEFLLTGAAEDFSWVKGASPTRLGFPSTSLPGSGGTTTPFLLHVSADFETLKGLYTLPAGSISEITRIRSTEVPGQPTGAIVISGRFAGLVGPTDAYWIARLDGNGVDKPIRTLEWIHVVKAPGDGPTKNRAARPGDFAERQPWDVRSDGQVVYAEGEPYATSWAALRVLSADGKTGVMPAWGDEGGPVIALKAGRKNSLRSTTAEDFEHRQEDENGNPGRKGRYPDDYYFGAFDSDRGPGYTGYRVGQNSTQRVSQLAIDRRDNALYFGTSTQSRLPGGLPDFEPAIVAMDAQGKLKWWARGYLENERAPGDQTSGDVINSPPDQYVDHVAVDYARNALLVLARCHGNNQVNLWAGNTIRANRGRPGFKTGFTGKASDIHISWLARYELHEVRILNATYVAEMAQGGEAGRPIPLGPLKGWPDQNSWNTLNTTNVLALMSDAFGRPVMVGRGRRPYTTENALIPNLKPTEGVSRWSKFLRAYAADLGSIEYSTLIQSKWNSADGSAPNDEITLHDVAVLNGGYLTLGSYRPAAEPPMGELPLGQAPAWGKLTPVSAASFGIIAVVPVSPPTSELALPPLESTKRRR